MSTLIKTFLKRILILFWEIENGATMQNIYDFYANELKTNVLYIKIVNIRSNLCNLTTWNSLMLLQ